MTDPDAPPTRRILAIDGGGLRGLIPACVLAALEASTGRAARDTFDFLAGTSTGAIIAAGLAAGVPAADLVRFYVDDAPRLFDGAWWRVVRRVVSGSMYDTRRLRELVAARLPADARGWLINDAPRDVLFTAKGLRDGHQWYFVKDCPDNACRTGGLPFVDCIVASAAAPTYLAPWSIEGLGELVDGGIGVAGNPVYQACVEAFTSTGRYRPAETVIVSSAPAASSVARARAGSATGWAGSCRSCSARRGSSRPS